MIYFRNTYMADLHFSFPTGEPVEFRYTTPDSLTVKLRSRDDTVPASWPGRFQVVCDAISEKPETDEIRAQYESFAAGILPEGYPRSSAESEGRLDERGLLRLPAIIPMRYQPELLQHNALSAIRELEDYTERTVKALRWQMGLVQAPQALEDLFAGARFSLNGEAWHQLPPTSKPRGSVRVYLVPTIDVGMLPGLESIVQAGDSEPLPHVLLREAWSLEDSNPKSALLICVVAAETAVKQYIARVVPRATWLVEEGPSPPVDKMLLHYLPALPSRAGEATGVVIPRKLITQFQEANKRRNHIAHRGKADLPSAFLRETLEAIQDLLWLLDYHSGHAWALGHVRPETLAEPSGKKKSK